jgi:hypothetical protein
MTPLQNIFQKPQKTLIKISLNPQKTIKIEKNLQKTRSKHDR